MSRRYLVVRYHHDHSKEVHEHLNRELSPIHHLEGKKQHSTKGIPFEVFANELMEYEPFVRYLQENGSHFTDQLADHCISMHKGKNFRNSRAVLEALADSQMKLPKDITLGDFTYLINTKYKNHPDAIAKALEELKDQPYPGFLFNRWLADHIGMSNPLSWEDFV